jgi:putative nucleotidyltransferase with HDIG domain
LKVLRIIDDGAYDIGKVADEVKKDQVISARTIQLCNSAMFTKRSDVVSLDHALVFLGQELFLKLVISAAVQSYYNQSGNGYSLCKGGLYHHAIGTAMIAEKIAATTGKAVPGVAYTAGLLHDIGKVVLDQYITGCLSNALSGIPGSPIRTHRCGNPNPGYGSHPRRRIAGPEMVPARTPYECNPFSP